MTNEEIMGSRIKQKRIENNLTMEELGKLVGVQKSAVNKWEHGAVSNMKRTTIQKLSEIFGCSVSYLMVWDEEEIVSISDQQSKLTEYEKQIEAVLVEIEEMHPTLEEMIQVKNYAEFLIKQRK